MAKEEALYQNFVSGEVAPDMHGRSDLPVARSGCKRLRNMILKTQGPTSFRPGFYLSHHTRRDRRAKGIKFEFNDAQAYGLEFTDKKMRVHKDNAILVESNKTVTGITQANPGVVTSNSHGFSNGDEVFLTGVKGMTKVNGRSYLVAGATANTFNLTDRDGNNVNTTGYAAYSSGGVANRIYEIDTPYEEALDLFKLKVTQNADTMYIDHPYYEPRKLTRTAHTSWILSLYARTNDPFTDPVTITGVTQASPGVVTAVAHGYAVDDIVIIETIVGMTELNSRVYIVNTVPTADTLTLKDFITGVVVDTSAYTAYSSAGYLSDQTLLPRAVGFYEGRLFHGGADATPDKFDGSMSPVPTTGVPRYDDFTTGTDPDDAVTFTIADAEVNKIFWFMGTNRLLFAGTFGTETKITGTTSDQAISPESINVRAENRLGVADVPPINKENIVIYVERGGLTLRSFEFDALSDAFVSADRNLIAEHVTKSGIKQLTWTSGRPNIVWAVTNDGRLLGLTFKAGQENIAGWHPHDTGVLLGDVFLDCFTMPRANKSEQLWVHTERVVNGITRRFFEYMGDEINLPQRADYYTGEDNKDDDDAKFDLALQEAQKEYMHVDCALTYDGTVPGSTAGATMTPASAAIATGVIFTASASVFVSTDVGRQIWKKAVAGVGYGRARITAVNSGVEAVCDIIQAFDGVTAMAAGNWYLTTDRLYNLEHLEGRSVSIVTDGAAHPAVTVSNGEAALEYHASVAHAGQKYSGHLQPAIVEGGGQTGSSQAKNRHVRKVGIRFRDTLGASFGTELYRMETIPFRRVPMLVGVPERPFTGVKELAYADRWSIDKDLIVRQENSLPCNILFLESWLETDDE